MPGHQLLINHIGIQGFIKETAVEQLVRQSLHHGFQVLRGAVLVCLCLADDSQQCPALIIPRPIGVAFQNRRQQIGVALQPVIILLGTLI